MAEYGVALNVGVRNQAIQFPGLATQTVVSVEIDFETNPVYDQNWIYLVDAGRGSPTGSGYIRFKNSGLFDFEAVTNIKIDGIAQSWSASGTTFAGSGLDTIAGKTLAFDILTGFAGTLSVGNIIAATAGVNCTIRAARVAGRQYDLNEGTGVVLQDTLAPGVNDGAYLNPPASDAQWILLSGGGAENYTGTAQSINTHQSINTGLKEALGTGLSSNLSASQIIGLARRFGLIQVSTPSTVATTGAKQSLGTVTRSISASTQALGVKQTAGQVASGHGAQAALVGRKHALGFMASVSQASTVVSGYEVSALLQKSGYAVSSQAPASQVVGFKHAVGVLLSTGMIGSQAQGHKASTGLVQSAQQAITSLMAWAARSGLILSTNAIRSVTTGYTGMTQPATRQYTLNAFIPSHCLQGVINSPFPLIGVL